MEEMDRSWIYTHHVVSLKFFFSSIPSLHFHLSPLSLPLFPTLPRDRGLVVLAWGRGPMWFHMQVAVFIENTTAEC